MKLFLFLVLTAVCSFAKAQTISFSSPDFSCGTNDTVTYTSAGCAGATYTWTFAGGKPATATGAGPFIVNWTTAGAHLVTVKEDNGAGCTHTTSKTTHSLATPDSALSGFILSTGRICEGNTVNVILTGGFNPQSQSLSLDAATNSNINVIADTIQVSYSTGGVKNITLTIQNNVTGCYSLPTTKTLIVKAAPSDSFTYSTSGCKEAVLTHTGSASSQAVYTWAVAGGGTPVPTGAGPSTVSWPSAGTYNVSLSVSDTTGCSAGPYTLPITVTNNIPTSTFNVSTSTVCAGVPVTFTYTGNAPGGATYNWNFNGGAGAGAGAGPQAIMWAAAGTYTVTLTVGSGSCSSATTSHTVAIYDIPTSTFTATSPVCISSPSTLTYTGTAPVGSTYTWSFNGGTGGVAGAGPQAINWAAAGTYTLTLKVAANGCTSTTSSATVVVSPTYTSTFTVPAMGICGTGNAATITYTGNAPGGATYNWNFNGGTGGVAGAGPQAIMWASAGTYIISLSVGSGSCTSAATSHTVTIHNVPTSTFNIDNPSICFGTNSTLTYAGNASVGATYTWNFAGGTATPGGTVPGPQSVAWGSPGIKVVSLTVTDGGCASTTNTQTIVVNSVDAPIAGSNSPVKAGNSIHLTASTIAAATYEWTGPNGFNSTEQNPTISKSTIANAGTYSVIAQANGCISNADTVNIVINNPSQLTLYMDTISAVSGQEALITISAKNFNNLISSQGTIQFDPAVLSFVQAEQFGVDSLNAGSFGTSQAGNGLITFAWYDRTLKGVTLPDGSTFFVLRFTITGTNGQFSPITFSNSPVVEEYIDSSFSTINAQLNPGGVNVGTNTRVAISGRIKTEAGAGVRSVSVTANGNPDFTVISDTTGNYSFLVNGDSAYIVSPAKSNDTIINNGITILDVLLIQRHILGTILLSSPYKIIAADVNQSGTIDDSDTYYITNLILGNTNSFPGNKLWNFVPADYVFSNPQNPFPYPNQKVYSSVSAQSNQDFIGMKLGDVNNTWNPAVARLEGADNNVQLLVSDMAAHVGTEISIPVKARNFNSISGFQFTLKWDKAILNFKALDTAKSILKVVQGTTQKDGGLLTIAWSDPNFASSTLPDDSALFYIKFSVAGSAGSNTLLSILSSPTPIEVVNHDLKDDTVKVANGLISIDLGTGIAHVQEISDLEIVPNPFVEETRVRFKSTQDESAEVSLIDLLGREIKRNKLQLCKGENEITLTNTFAPGTYYLKIAGEKMIKTAKLILLK